MLNYLLAIGFVLALLLCWCAVQKWARHYARRHPEFGPAREEGGGCGLTCQCSNPCEESQCRRKNNYE
ncbi:MAG: hypothetical protein PVF82_13205 [Gammaproteobacteria bacterium]